MNLPGAKTRLSLVLALLIAAFAVAGCGGSSGSSNSKDTFNKAYAPINDQIKAIGTRIGTAITTASGKTDAAFATEFQAIATDFDAIKTQLSALKPPSEDKADFDALTSAMEPISTDLHALVTAAQTRDTAGARATVQKFAADASPLKTARRALALKTGATP